MVENELMDPLIGRKENGELEHCGTVETVFHVQKCTMTTGIPDMTILYQIGNQVTPENGIINPYIFVVITETIDRKN